MKYRTRIDVICDAANGDEAVDMAGEYLRGGIDSGVQMECRAVPLSAWRIAKYGTRVGIMLLFVFSIFSGAFKFSGSGSGVSREYVFTPGTSTVQPELKTTGKCQFKKEWKKKKDEAILDYIRN